jgi:hypothetical protein
MYQNTLDIKTQLYEQEFLTARRPIIWSTLGGNFNTLTQAVMEGTAREGTNSRFKCSFKYC